MRLYITCTGWCHLMIIGNSSFHWRLARMNQEMGGSSRPLLLLQAGKKTFLLVFRPSFGLINAVSFSGICLCHCSFAFSMHLITYLPKKKGVRVEFFMLQILETMKNYWILYFKVSSLRSIFRIHKTLRTSMKFKCSESLKCFPLFKDF